MRLHRIDLSIVLFPCPINASSHNDSTGQCLWPAFSNCPSCRHHDCCRSNQCLLTANDTTTVRCDALLPWRQQVQRLPCPRGHAFTIERVVCARRFYVQVLGIEHAVHQAIVQRCACWRVSRSPSLHLRARALHFARAVVAVAVAVWRVSAHTRGRW